MLADIVVIAILVVVFALVIHTIVKAKKAGKNLQCGMDCSHCKGCH
ncbi:FeoB-associated Cys-rich membrane protein [Agathobacter sp.]